MRRSAIALGTYFLTSGQYTIGPCNHSAFMKVKQGLLLLFAVLIGGGAAAGATAAYYWQRATAVPTWYASSTASSNLATNLDSGSQALQQQFILGDQVQYLSDREVEITLTEAELNALIQEGLRQTAETESLLQATQGLKATIQDDRLQAGMVVNPAHLPMQDLPTETQQVLQQAFESMPMLKNREWYVGIAGNPQVENGQLVLGEDTQIQVGNVQLSVAEVARLTNLNPTQLTQKINRALSQTGVTLSDLEFSEGQMILRGTTE